MPRMGTYTQADADRDIAVHAALTTAIHGVGSLHVAGFGVAGQELSKIIWKDESETAIDDMNRTATSDWTELDLTDFTSERAKFAILRVRFRADTVGSGPSPWTSIRKKGTTPGHYPRVRLDLAGTTEGVYNHEMFIVGLDSERKVEYMVNPTTGWQVDTRIEVLGYIE